jgi:F-type H+-transporting ATPase subunit epsilon
LLANDDDELPKSTFAHHDRCLEERLHVCLAVKHVLEVECSQRLLLFSYNKFAQITARAVRSSLKDDLRVAAEKRGQTNVRYQQWQDGKGGAQVRCVLNVWNVEV